MEQTEKNPTLTTMINYAFSKEYPGNRFSYEKRSKEKDQFLKGINEKSEKLKWETEGQIDLTQTLSEISLDSTSFLQDIDDFIASKTNGKYQYALRFETLLNYMNYEHQTNFSTDILRKYQVKDADRRRLDLLKKMHSHLNSPKSMGKIAEELGVDIKTIRDDFNSLERDFSFLDTEIRIKGFDKKNEIHNSPVHPIFLALNSTQVYSLLFALKVIAHKTVFEDSLLEIAHAVYTQLSEAGQEMVSDLYQLDDLPKGFKREFISSVIFMRKDDINKILHAITYKIPCTLTFTDNGVNKQVSGVPSILENGEYNTFIITGLDGSETRVHRDSVVADMEFKRDL